MHSGFMGKPEENDYWEDPGIRRREILKWLLEKSSSVVSHDKDQR
jgi:hypothetical protein